MDIQEIKIKMADPTAIGQFGLAMVTLVASTAKLGWTSGTSFIIPWAIFLGSIAQLYAAVVDAKQGKLFGATVFGAYGLFWISVAMSWMISNGMFGEGMLVFDVKQLGFAFVGYLIFSLIATYTSFTTNKVLIILLVLIDVLFIGLAVSTLTGNEFAHEVAAWTELAISIVGFYGVAANFFKGHFGREILPLGKPIMTVEK
jgi:succinate-acetate transporter protein